MVPKRVPFRAVLILGNKKKSAGARRNGGKKQIALLPGKTL
jgi:hypothetical protein